MSDLILPPGLRDEILAAESTLAPARVPMAETFLRDKGVNVFRCPVCHKEFRQADEYEPLCSGPNEMADDHSWAVMQFVRVEPRLYR